MNLKIDETKFQELIDKLDKQITSLETAYNEIDKKMVELDGNHEVWQSDTQKTVYDYYIEIKEDFPKSVQNFKDYRDFLKNTLANYSNSIKSNLKDVDDNGDNFNIN